MAYSYIAGAAVGSADSNNATTGGIDTSGANLLVVVISFYGAGAPTVSDSKSNSWTGLTLRSFASGYSVRMFYSIPTSVGSSHTFTVSSTAEFTAIAVQGWSGAHATPLDQENGYAAASGTSHATGSITPSEDNCLVVWGLELDIDATSTSDVGTKSNEAARGAGTNLYVGMWYLVQTTAGAINPNLSWTSSVGNCAAITSFKAAAVAGGTTHFLPTLGAGA